MSNRKLEIGKGLRALISDIDNIDIDKKTETVKQLASSIAEISLEQIEVNPMQPRTDFDPQALQELSDSIKEHGLIQPITVRSMGGDRFQLISGERRFRASKMAGLAAVPAYIRIADDQAMLEMAIIENIQRQDLNALEVALGYQRLIDECQLTHDQLSKRLGKNRTSVTNHLRLLKLPPSIKNGLRQAQITMGHARALVGVDHVDQQLSLYQRCISQQLSVRQLEALIRSTTTPNVKAATKASNMLSPEWESARKALSDYVGSKVDLQLSQNGSGKIIVAFSDLDHFNSIIDAIQD